MHAHFVYGVDDGAKTKTDMEAMLDAANAEGIASLFATPHVTPGVRPFDYPLFAEHFEQARQYCLEKQYPMALYAGAEIMYTPAVERYALERKLVTLGGSDEVLMEFTPGIAFSEIEHAAELMEHSGYRLIIAHIERYDCLFHLRNARRLKARYDVQYQVNCNSVIHGCGFWRDWHIHGWLRDELIDFISSDAHDCKRRPFKIRKAYSVLKKSYDKSYVNQLVGLR